MNLRAFMLLCMLIPLGALAQKKEKPRLLIYGSNAVAWTAAVQATQSNVPTVSVYNEPINSQFNLNKWAESLKNNHKPDSLNKDPDSIDALELGTVGFNKVNDAVNPLLTEIENRTIKKLDKTKRGWQVTLSDNQKFNVIAIIDATENSDLVKMSKLDFETPTKEEFTLAKEMTLPLSRTTVATLNTTDSINKVVFLEDILKAQKDNLFGLGRGKYLLNEKQNDSGTIAFSKALGVTAGYLAFFKTDASKIDVRKLQAELINFSNAIIPYQDVRAEDSHFKAIVKCYLTGFFLGKEQGNKYIFDKNAAVRFEEIKPVLNDIYTRSQLWFLDNYRDEDLTWKDLISLIRFISFKGDEVDRQIKKDWNTKLKFEGEYNSESKVTREQFAVMTDLFSTAFAKAINLDGTFVK